MNQNNDPYGNYLEDTQNSDFGENRSDPGVGNLGVAPGVGLPGRVKTDSASPNSVSTNSPSRRVLGVSSGSTGVRKSRRNSQLKPMSCMYGVFHMIIAIFALYLSFKCNNGFALGDFLLALFCPVLYIIYRLAVSENFCQK
jgi:hypothetical protein